MISFLRSIGDFHFKKKKKISQYIMMENLSPKEENIIKNIRNLFRLKKEQNYTVVKDIKNLLRLKKKLKGLKI